jgi:hypothetical protein
MQRALLLVAIVAGCKAGTTKEQELCARAAARFEKCEELDLGSGSDAPIAREMTIDRWRGLCRAVFTGKTEQLMQNARELFAAMDEGTKAGLRIQAECTAKATTCAEYKKCDE